MCDLCALHGGGKKWYLNQANYSKELAQEQEPFIEELWRNMLKANIGAPEIIDWLKRNAGRHRGQLVPREDVIKILELTEKSGYGYTVLGVCSCRLVARGEYVPVCIGFGIVPDTARKAGFRLPKEPTLREKIKKAGIRVPLTVGEVKDELLDKWEERGLVHSVFTFGTPYIGGICNCEWPTCLALNQAKASQFPVMGEGVLRAEYFAKVDPDECTGCGECAPYCQFGAIHVSKEAGRAYIDITKCFGCGLCRFGCDQNAITLVDRSKAPLTRNLWAPW